MSAAPYASIPSACGGSFPMMLLTGGDTLFKIGGTGWERFRRWLGPTLPRTSARVRTSFSADETWTYDDAGNRANSGYTYDSLNRMTASPGSTTYENDVLGNRTWRNKNLTGAVRYIWDAAGRLSKAAGASNGATYDYRADGMRMKKVTGLQLVWIEAEGQNSGFYDEIQNVNMPTYRYRYDGQMGFEDDYTVAVPGSPPTVTITGNAYALGARGIDMIRTFTVNPSTYARTYDSNGKMFPLYDGHGNMIATAGRASTSSAPFFSVGNVRAYDVWGGVRSGSSSGDPSSRYCANLGHKSDDESGLIYMRARYYEPGTGRFVSEDPARDGLNWFGYCGNELINRVDRSGQSAEAVTLTLFGMAFIGLAIFFNWVSRERAMDMLAGCGPMTARALGRATTLAVGCAALGVACFAAAVNGLAANNNRDLNKLITVYLPIALTTYGFILAGLVEAGKIGSSTAAAAVVYAAVMYSSMCLGILLSMHFD